MNLNFIRNPDVRKLVRDKLRDGWSLVRTHKGHAKLIPPAGRFVIFSCGSGNDPHALENLKSEIRKCESSSPLSSSPPSPSSSETTSSPPSSRPGGCDEKDS